MKEALRQALDMLNEIADDVYCDQKLEGVITALRQALETEQEPVAWISATFCDELDTAYMAELIEKDLKEKNT